MGCASSVAAVAPRFDTTASAAGVEARPERQKSWLVARLSRPDLPSVSQLNDGPKKALSPAEDSVGVHIDDPTIWRSAASVLARTVLPFVPERVSAAFAEGRLARPFGSRGGSEDEVRQRVSSVRPKGVTGVLLILDISGFTRLSQDAQRRLGSEGVERFSLAISAFFSLMLPVIVKFRGDVDCFAGDAVLVVFESQAGRTAECGLSEAAHRALECTQALHVRLDGFQHEPEDPPLRVHSALAAGELMCIECGGELAQRCEAFLLGLPLLEIAPALTESSAGQIVLAPSVSHLLSSHTSVSGKSFRGQLPQGHSVSGQRNSRGKLNLRRCASSGSAMGARNQVCNDDMGLMGLLSFMPECVRPQCLLGQNLTTMMEHRVVTILFIVADMEEHASKFKDLAWISQLQSVLGQSINTVEAQFGGATRQITMDDKGLAMIFVFGLPGYQSNRQSVPSIIAARKVLQHLSGAGIHGSAGISAGTCFCGLVGNPNIRCEYAVMGDHVNTAARLAGAGAKRGHPIMCTEAVYHATTPAHLAAHALTLEAAESLLLKGKQGEVCTYVPIPLASHNNGALPEGEIRPVCLRGRDAEMKLLERALDFSNLADATGVVLVVVEGEAGVGKSALAETIMQQGLATGTLQWLLVRGTEYDDSSPLLACRAIVCWLLELQGDPCAESMSWLMGDFELDDENLPALLQPYAEDLEALRDDHHDNSLPMQVLYTRLIWDALQRGGIALLLEDVDALDGHSQHVLQCVANMHKNAASLDRERSRQRGPPSILFCTSRVIDMLSIGEAVPAREQPEDARQSVCLKLAPLERDAVKEMACDCLGSALDESAADLIAGRSNGIPLQVVELCAWLQSQQLVIDGRLSAKAAGLDLMNYVPPNMQATIQAQVDQVPMVPGMMLRFASALGLRFSSQMLLAILPPGLVADEGELEEQLQVLCEARLIEHVRPGASSRNMFDAEETWKFRNRLHQEVLYSSMAHKHRRSLHAAVAAYVRQKMQERGRTYMELRPILKALTSHLLRALPAGDTTKGQQYQHIGGRQLRDLESAIGKAAKNSLAVGDYQEAVAYWDELLGILQEQNIMAEDPVVELLEAESRALDSAKSCFMALSLYSMKVAGVISPKQRLQEMEARQTELLGKIAEVNNTWAQDPAREVTDRRRNSFALLEKRPTDSSPSFKLARQVSISTKFGAVWESLAAVGFVKTDKLRSLMDELQDEGTPQGRAYIGAHICTALMNQATCWERASMGKEMHAAFRDAGEPHQLRDIPGHPISISITALWLSGQLWSGQLGDAAEDAATDTAAKVDMSQAGFLITLRECVEASWEPLTSPRVQSQRRQRRAAGTPRKPWDHMANCLRHLHAASAVVATLGPDAFQDRNATAAADALASLRLAVKTAGASVEAGAQMPQACVVMACVAEGCRVLFPGGAAPPAPPTPTALRHLAGVSEELSSCLQLWARWGSNVFGHSFLPSTMMLGRAMLHLFQWWLRHAGDGAYGRVAPEPIHLLLGARAKKPQPALLHGPAQVASGLMMAQQHGAARGELLPGCLPATVALARLLLAGAGQCEPGLEAELRASTAMVAVALPPFLPDGDAEPAIGVQRVQFGSPSAARVAAAHLAAVLAHVTVGGQPLAPDKVEGPADVAGSASLWEAVGLLRLAQGVASTRSGVADSAGSSVRRDAHWPARAYSLEPLFG
eukprot:jgi/Tetstr1/440953/TSEL_029222.t1